MSAEPPPKPKPGSLRDRIAAFETKPASNTQPPPAPRPKPGHVQWKPKVASPPSSPKAGATSESTSDATTPERKYVRGGMSATDAKESIVMGGSLKERMAALQGKGAFGAPAPAPPPLRPTSDKPRWKPPVAVLSPEPGDAPLEESAEADHEETKALSPKAVSATEAAGEEPKDHDGTEGTQPDAEEDERQRRAAIAARMARLGGARLGMAPPIFAPKPTVKKAEVPKEEHDSSTEEPKSASTEKAIPESGISASLAPLKDEHDQTMTAVDCHTEIDIPKAPSQTSVVPSDSLTSSRSPPTSMPVPAGPRRAAPPRKRPAAKTSSPSSTGTPSEDAASGDLTLATSAEAVVSPISVIQPPESIPEEREDQEEKITSPPKHDETRAVEDELHEVDGTKTVPSPAAVHVTKDETTEPVTGVSTVLEGDAVEAEQPASKEPTTVQEEPSQETEPEEDEAARRKRIAERIAKSGGLNPFGAPLPPRRQSTSSDHSSSPLSAKSDAPVSPSSPPQDRPHTLRKTSRDSSYGPGRVQVLPTTQSPVSPSPSDSGFPTAIRRGSSDSGRSNLAGQVVSEEPTRLQSEITEEPEVEEQDDQDIMEHSDAVHHAFNTTSPLREVREGSYLVDSENIDDNVHDRKVEWDSSPRGEHEASDEFVEDDMNANVDETLEDDYDEHEHFEESDIHLEQKSVDGELKYASFNSEKATTNDIDNTEFDDENDEMAPPRIRRPLPPPPAEFVEEETQASESLLQSNPPSLPPPVGPPSKRRSLPPPRAPPSPPLPPTFNEQDESDTDNAPFTPHQTIPAPLPVLEDLGEIQEEPDSVLEFDEDVEIEEEHRQVDEYIDEEGALQSSEGSRCPSPDQPTTASKRPLVNHNQHEDARFPPMSTFPPPPPLPPNRPTRGRSLSPGRVKADYMQLSAVPLPAPDKPLQEEVEQEVIDEHDGDPIDPGFHSPTPLPARRSTSPLNRPIVPPLERAPSPPTESPSPRSEGAESGETAKKRTIAERMAKLGGLKFGAPLNVPIRPPRPPPPPPPVETAAEKEAPERSSENVDAQASSEDEEEEAARRARIATKLASMGGLRLGMVPSLSGPNTVALPRTIVDNAEKQATSLPPRSAPPRPNLPSPPPLTQSDQSIISQGSELEIKTESDVVRIGEEDSELDEVNATDLEDTEPMTPPPIPPRSERRPLPERQRTSSSTSRFVEDLPPPLPPGRRPMSPSSHSSVRVPTDSIDRKFSGESSIRPSSPHMQKSSSADYVLVDEPEEEEEIPPPPPPRSISSGPPRRTSVVPTTPIPPPPPPPLPSSSLVEAQSQSLGGLNDSQTFASEWGLPNIPDSTLDLSVVGDMSASSWSEDSTSYPPPLPVAHPPRPSKSLPAQPAQQNAEVRLTGDELLALWGRVGVHLGEVANMLYDKSKKTLIGDGTFTGFVNAVLTQVATARVPSQMSKYPYGHLIYAQTADTVQKRLAEIMPGDVITLEEARFKGYKGLHQSYQQNVGFNGVPVVGVVGEFDTKKSKVKVFEANQHVGGQTVQSVSYRLEDLKSGSMMIFRVADA